jgi:hypothetical protein
MELFRKLLLLLYFRGLMYQKSSSVTIDVLTHRSIYVYWLALIYQKLLFFNHLSYQKQSSIQV